MLASWIHGSKSQFCGSTATPFAGSGTVGHQLTTAQGSALCVRGTVGHVVSSCSSESL